VSISSSKATICRVDASAVRAADRHVLVGYAAAIAGNARDLLGDAEVLLSAGRWARAHSQSPGNTQRNMPSGFRERRFCSAFAMGQGPAIGAA
jgi:hypothetical protein